MIGAPQRVNRGHADKIMLTWIYLFISSQIFRNFFFISIFFSVFLLPFFFFLFLWTDVAVTLDMMEQRVAILSQIKINPHSHTRSTVLYLLHIPF